jgi:DivIVA domain-containing protein
MDPSPPALTQLDIRDLDVRRKGLPSTTFGLGYRVADVDAFLDEGIGAIRSLLEENEVLRAGVSPEHLWYGKADARRRLTPLDVQAREFEVARFGNGYKMRPVDEILDDVTDMLAQLEAENDALRAGRPRQGD